MKICFVLPHAGLAGGIKVAAIYANLLRARGHEVTLVSVPRRRQSGVLAAQSLLRGKLLSVRRHHGPSHLDGLDLDWRVVESRRPIQDKDVPDGDVVIATWWETAEWVAGLAPSKGIKAYFIQHHEVHDGQPKDRVADTWRLPLHKITISKWLSEVNQRIYGLGAIPVIHNSVDMEQFHAPDRPRGNPPTVGLLYSSTYWKGVKDSFSAIEIARRVFPHLRILMFGSQQEVASLPLPDSSELVVRPHQDRIREVYGRCDYWLCGSLAEGFHLPPLEAMACRLPVISTEVGGPMDTIRDGVNGYLSAVGIADELGANLVKALKLSDDEWKAMSDAALRTATDYTWDDATDLFEAELRRIVEAGSLNAPV